MSAAAPTTTTMGVFYNSICLPGQRGPRVRESLGRWLALRGFEEVHEPTLFDLDGDTERSAYLLWNEHWTVLVYSAYEEERRLIRELQTWAENIVYVWVQDSDVWGYDLLGPQGFAGSFASDPRSYQSFRDEPMGESQRPQADPEVLCQRLGLDGKAAEVRRIERRSAAFEEDVCLEFCQLIGADAAMVSYDDLERGTVESLEGWNVEHWLFRHRDALERQVEADLHTFSLSGREEIDDSWVGQRSATDIIPSLPEAMRQVRQHGARPQRRPGWGLLRPLAWLAKRWRRWTGDPSSPLFPTVVVEQASTPGGEEVQVLTNPRHGFQVDLAPGMAAEPMSGKPASVFSIRIGETVVTCTSRRLEKVPEVLQRPHRSEILIDTPSTIHGMRARHVLFQLPPLYLAGRPDPSYLGLHVIEAPKALYVFLYRSQDEPDPAVLDAIGGLVASFRPLGTREGLAGPRHRP